MKSNWNRKRGSIAVLVKKEWIKQLDAEKEHVIKILFGR